MSKNLICLIIGICSCLVTFARQKYNVGDVLYGQDGKAQGVIFWIHPDRTEGWAVAMENIGDKCYWGTTATHIPGLDDLSSVVQGLADLDGYGNTGKIRAFYGEGSLYAAQQVDYANGWYLPSVGQMRRLMAVSVLVDSVLVSHGGSSLFEEATMGAGFWTSNSWSNDEACSGDFINYFIKQNFKGKKDGYTAEKQRVRAIRTFKITEESADGDYTYRWNTGAASPNLTIVPQVGKNDYALTVTPANGKCATTAHKSVWVAAPGETEYYDTICKGERYTKNGFNTAEPGIHQITLPVGAECSVALKLNLTVADTFHLLLTDHFCKGTPYQGHNFTAYHPGVYEQHWTTQQGCDSVVTLELSECLPYDTAYRESVCFGDSYHKYGFRINALTRDTVCVRHSFTPQGCDSLIRLELTIAPPVSLSLYDSACIGMPYTGFGHFSLPGITKDTVCEYLTQSVHGCDSTIYLNLKAIPLPRKLVVASLCEGEIYADYGFHLTASGEYDTVVPAATGCDTLLHLSLTVHPTEKLALADSVCAGEEYHGNGAFHLSPITKDTLCTAALQSMWGCDSLVELHLKYLPLQEGYVSAVIKKGESYTAYGLNVSEPGEYVVKWPSTLGCDSLITVSLARLPVYEMQVITAICDGEAYTEYGFHRTTPGLDTITVPGNNGTDTVVYLELDVYPTWQLNKSDAFCEGSRYLKYGLDVTEEGEYPVLLKTGRGCDSLIRLTLTANPVWNTLIDTTLETGSVFVREDFTTQQKGEYEFRYTGASGCDSIVTVRLDFAEPFKIPNTFSPNGDGVNDLFMKGCRIEIIDRNGIRLFQGTDGWDGTYQGKQVPVDTYFYILYYPTTEGEKIKKGFISVAR